MVWLSDDLERFLKERHPEIVILMYVGNVELFTKEMEQEYYKWKERKRE